MRAGDVIDVLIELSAVRGVPRHIRSDNGPEFIAQAIRSWLRGAKIDALYIAPASPWQNGFAESFHSKLRDELLAVEVFDTLAEAKTLGMTWRRLSTTIAVRSRAGLQDTGVAASLPRLQSLRSLRRGQRRNR